MSYPSIVKKTVFWVERSWIGESGQEFFSQGDFDAWQRDEGEHSMGFHRYMLVNFRV
jgi:hypothetical protein